MNRRSFLLKTAGAGALGVAGVYGYSTLKPIGLQRFSKRVALSYPQHIDARKTGQFSIQAQGGLTQFVPNVSSTTLGFNQSYLGPVIRVNAKGTTKASVSNQLTFPITSHWHGLIIPGVQDGGPHQVVESGKTWSPELTIDQPAAMTWYHSHIAGQTAQQVYAGLAGPMILDDGRDNDRGLPVDYGQDDLVMVVQDKLITDIGKMEYSQNMHHRMTGFVGNTMLVNGQIDPVARVPKSVVRIRFLNASNAGTHVLSFADGRPFYIVATDSGYLSKPKQVTSVAMAPAERFQVLVDFSDGKEALIVTKPERAFIGNGFMGTMMKGRAMAAQLLKGKTALVAFKPDASLPAKITQIPNVLDGVMPDLTAKPIVTRTLQLATGMGQGGGMMGAAMTINGKPYEMDRVDFDVKRNTIEKWIITPDVLSHPFHIHGVKFAVLSEGGKPPPTESQGWKDTVLVSEETEVLISFTQPAAPEKPFMFHCHILEHEDAGMMGQFSVT